MEGRRVRRFTALLALSTTFVACNRDIPTAPTTDGSSAFDDEPSPSDGPPDLGVFLSERAHVMLPDEVELTSSAEDLQAGLYRYRAVSGPLPTIARDDFIIGATDEAFVRLVLGTEVDDGTLTIDTGPAYWHDVLQAGTYQVTIPVTGDAQPSLAVNGIAQVALPLTFDSLQLPGLEKTFADVDICAWLDEKWVGRHGEPFCGADKQWEGTIARNVFSLNGTVDSLRIVRGWVRLTAEADIGMTVDPGGLEGGQAPIFAPCNVGNYLGCITTPTGAALIDFLRKYAPQIPDSSLAPVRLCIPGSYVRTARGYWSGLTYNPPVWTKCTIPNIGQLPTLVPGSFQAAMFELRPELQGQIDFRVKGDGQLGVEIAIPGLSVSRGITSSKHFAGKVQLGLFVPLAFAMNNNAATVRVDFHQKRQLHQEWDPNDGWSYYDEPVFQQLTPTLLDFDRPDTLAVSAGVMVKGEAVLCAAVVKCDLDLEPDSPAPAAPAAADEGPDGILGAILGALDITETFTVQGRQEIEVEWSREQVHPTDTLIDNWKIGQFGVWSASLGYKLETPGWFIPPKAKENTWGGELTRARLSDGWGQARFKVTTTTTGEDLDPDGYRAVIQRTDTLPTLVDPEAQRVGPWIAVTWRPPVGLNDSHVVGLPDFVPCPVVYSDIAIFAVAPIAHRIIDGARVNGGGVPNYGVAYPCPLTVAQYDIELTGVAENCTVAGGAVQDSVWLQQSRAEPPRTDTTFIQFDVTCVAADTPGDIHLTLLGAAGIDPGPLAELDGGGRWDVPTDTVTLTGLTPGARVLQMTGLPGNCTSDPVNVTVTPGGTTPATASISCTTPPVPPEGKVAFVSSVTGAGMDTTGYVVRVDGLPAAALAATDTAIAADLPGETPTVFMVDDIDGNCRADSENPRIVTLNAARDSVWIPFPVTCTSTVPDTVDALVDATAWPTPSVSLLLDGGGSLAVNGPLVGELTRLAGTRVRAWGTTSATGIAVNGYDLRSSLGDDRWRGILLVRNGVSWLLGEDAIQLVNPPATLTSLEGAYVWVTGVEAIGGVRPTLFGVIRDAP